MLRLASGHPLAGGSARGAGENDERHQAAPVQVGRSTGTASDVLDRPDAVAEATGARVREAIDALGFARGGAPSTGLRTGGGTGSPRGFHTGRFGPVPEEGTQEARPVPLLGGP